MEKHKNPLGTRPELIERLIAALDALGESVDISWSLFVQQRPPREEFPVEVPDAGLEHLYAITTILEHMAVKVQAMHRDEQGNLIAFPNKRWRKKSSQNAKPRERRKGAA